MESYLLDASLRVCRPIVAHAIGASLSSWPSHMYCFVPYMYIYIYIHVILIVKHIYSNHACSPKLIIIIYNYKII